MFEVSLELQTTDCPIQFQLSSMAKYLIDQLRVVLPRRVLTSRTFSSYYYRLSYQWTTISKSLAPESTRLAQYKYDGKLELSSDVRRNHSLSKVSEALVMSLLIVILGSWDLEVEAESARP